MVGEAFRGDESHSAPGVGSDPPYAQASRPVTISWIIRLDFNQQAS